MNPKSQLGSMKQRYDVLVGLYNLISVCTDSCTLDKDEKSSKSLNYYSNWFSKDGKEPFKLLSNYSTHGLESKKDQKQYAITTMEKSHKISQIKLEFDIMEMMPTLMPLLADFWIEASANVFDNELIEDSFSFKLLHICLMIMTILWRNTKTTSSFPMDVWLDLYQKHFSIHFPFGAIKHTCRDNTVQNRIQELNLLYSECICRVSSLYPNSKTNSLLKPIMKYILEVLNPDQSGMIRPIQLQELQTCYPIFDILLPGDSGSHVFECILNLKSVDRTCKTQESLFDYISNLIRNQFKNESSVVYQMKEKCLEWILKLPKRLWESRLNHPLFSKV